MKRFLLFSLIILSVFLALFSLSLALNIPFDSVFAQLASGGGTPGVIISIALLISDVVLPVPSSLIMIANGALYGPVWGALISLIGGIGATLTGYGIGRGGEKRALQFLKPEELDRGRYFFSRWGMLALIISRPIPLLSETLAVMAGLAGWGVGRTLISAIAGYLPACLIYAYSGAYVSQNDYGTTVFLLVIGIGLLVWLGSTWMSKKQKSRA